MNHHFRFVSNERVNENHLDDDDDDDDETMMYLNVIENDDDVEMNPN